MPCQDPCAVGEPAERWTWRGPLFILGALIVFVLYKQVVAAFLANPGLNALICAAEKFSSAAVVRPPSCVEVRPVTCVVFNDARLVVLRRPTCVVVKALTSVDVNPLSCVVVSAFSCVVVKPPDTCLVVSPFAI